VDFLQTRLAQICTARHQNLYLFGRRKFYRYLRRWLLLHRASDLDIGVLPASLSVQQKVELALQLDLFNLPRIDLVVIIKPNLFGCSIIMASEYCRK
jgi:hypothetical protein